MRSTIPDRVALNPPADEREVRSGFGAVPGAELPSFVYISVVAAFGWIMLASLLAFARDAYADLALGIACVLALIFFALPILIHHSAVVFTHAVRQQPREFLSARVETATGPLTGADVWLQVLIIPLALALAATLIGAVDVLVRVPSG